MDRFRDGRGKMLTFVGLTTVLFAVSVLHWPTVTVVALVLLFASYTIVDEFRVLAAATRAAALEQTRR